MIKFIKNKILIILILIIMLFTVIYCSGITSSEGLCAFTSDYIECLRLNNNRVPAFYSEFSMLYMGGKEQHTLDGIVYIDSKNNNYFLELSLADITTFKGSVKGNDVKILYRTASDEFEGIIGKLSDLELKKYTTLDFEIDTILKVLSLRIPIYEEYDNCEQNPEKEKIYTLKKPNIKDELLFADVYPQVKRFLRKIYKNDIPIKAYDYKYYAYAEAVFNDDIFYFPQKTNLDYYPYKNGQIEKSEKRTVQVGIYKIEFKNKINESAFDFDFPEGIKIHYED